MPEPRTYRIVCLYKGGTYIWKGWARGLGQARAILVRYLKEEFRLDSIYVTFVEEGLCNDLSFEKGYVDVRGFKKKNSKQMTIFELL